MITEGGNVRPRTSQAEICKCDASCHSHSCERCVRQNYASQLNTMQTSLIQVISNMWFIIGCQQFKNPPNGDIYKAFNHRLFSPRGSHTCLVIVYLLFSSCGWWQHEMKAFGVKTNLPHNQVPLPFFRLALERNKLLSVENQMWGWNETIFILLLAFPLLVIHHSDWKQWERWSTQETTMTECFWGTWEGSSYPAIRAKLPNSHFLFLQFGKILLSPPSIICPAAHKHLKEAVNCSLAAHRDGITQFGLKCFPFMEPEVKRWRGWWSGWSRLWMCERTNCVSYPSCQPQGDITLLSSICDL